MIGRLIQQQQIRRAHQRLRKQHAPFHAAGQRSKVDLFRKIQTGQHLLHAQIQIPAMLRFDLVLHVAERSHVAGFSGMRGDQMMVLRQQRAEFAQARGNHVENIARRVLRYFLGEPRDAHAALHAHFAVVRLDLARKQAQQGGLAFAVAADNAHALVRLDRQIDMFEQERAADAVVDALELDQGHGLL